MNGYQIVSELTSPFTNERFKGEITVKGKLHKYGTIDVQPKIKFLEVYVANFTYNGFDSGSFKIPYKSIIDVSLGKEGIFRKLVMTIDMVYGFHIKKIKVILIKNKFQSQLESIYKSIQKKIEMTL